MKTATWSEIHSGCDDDVVVHSAKKSVACVPVKILNLGATSGDFALFVREDPEPR